MQFPEIAAEISRMVEVDQEMRIKSFTDDSVWDDSVDARHTARMKQIVAEIGWPTAGKVGEKASSEAWLLVQHADRDRDFQQHCLTLMKNESEDEVRPRDRAMLEDRVLAGTGRPQLYGTQFQQKEGKHVPLEIEDPERVNERRAAVGLGTLEEGIALMYDKYGTPT